MDINAELHKGLQLHQGGSLEQARVIYESVINLKPQHYYPYYLLGSLELQAGNLQQAERWLRESLTWKEDESVLNNLGLVYQNAGRQAEAVECFRKALAVKPDFQDAEFNLAVSLQKGGKADESAALMAALAKRQPDSYDVHYNLGRMHLEEERYREAAEHLVRAVELNPTFVRGFYEAALALEQLGDFETAEFLYQRGIQLDAGVVELYRGYASMLLSRERLTDVDILLENALKRFPGDAALLRTLADLRQAQDSDEEAAALYEEALAKNPDDTGAWISLSIIYDKRKEYARAAEAAEKALALRPDEPDILYNLGTLRMKLEKPEEAEELLLATLRLEPGYANAYNQLGLIAQGRLQYEKAEELFNKGLELNPESLETMNNLGFLYHYRLELEKSIATFEQLLSIQPDFANAHKNLGFTLLLKGDYERGWEEFEWRWKTDPSPRKFHAPRWDGQMKEGLRLYLHHEQGFGDTVHCARYFQQLKEGGVTVLLEVQKELRTLFDGHPWVNRLVTYEEMSQQGAYDACLPLFSLPRAFATRLDNIPEPAPWLKVKPEFRETWTEKLGAPADGKKRLGIVWAGSPTHMNDKNRSIPLPLLEPLFSLEGVEWYSLQKGKRAAEFGGAVYPVTDLSEELNTFDDTLAVIERLDLVVTVDTVIAHLAGALGKECHVLLPYCPDWRWLLHRDDSPWYSSLQLVRQSTPGGWNEVVAEERKMLEKMG